MFPLAVFTESLSASAVPRCRLPHGHPGTRAQSSPSPVQSVQRGLLVRVSVGAEQPWARGFSSCKEPLLLLWGEGLGATGSSNQEGSSAPGGQGLYTAPPVHVVCGNSQSGDQQAAQTLAGCTVVCATRTRSLEIVCVCLPARVIYILLFIIFSVLIFITHPIIHNCGLYLLGVYSVL